ncbi:unnamed protein product [Acanthoscelides obtectus]|uniref:Uncharacterized protein n=1 Tax=Acanthoscelides obtectus TaxID=200917 RepID=A0A9P0MBP1_ACAOB|nr:unnamed protein product [Acanthoscelides obtectus]CAK1623123.1 hypothetical protein AOBTE_LOCUS1817 [Acanthoscelides obtectus]
MLTPVQKMLLFHPSRLVSCASASRYTTAEGINNTFLKFKQLLEEFNFQVAEVETKKSGDVAQVDSFAQVLQAHLQQLETIELKIIQMRSKLSRIEYFFF